MNQINIDMDQKQQDTAQMKEQNNTTQPDENSGVYVEGHIKIFGPNTKEEFVNKRNAIHYENMSEALAYCLANKGKSFIYEMYFGNGGTSVDPTGIITYLPTNTNVQEASLYNATFGKIIDDTSAGNIDPVHNKITVNHVSGTVYTDILVTCLLDYGEPAGQGAFDNTTNLDSKYVFDELGLIARSTDGTVGELAAGVFTASTGKLLTHVIFHPVQKSLNRQIQIDYTVRIQTLTNLSSIG